MPFNQKLIEEYITPKQTSQEKVVSRRGLILLAIMGIIGLILLTFGVFAIFEISILLGATLIVLGILTYAIFVAVERRLKIL